MNGHGDWPPEFRALRATDGYSLELPRLATELRVERLRRERGELVGELTVACALPATKAANGILSVADFNLSSARARTERSRILADRSNMDAGIIDWAGILETFCQHVIEAERIGQPAVLLRDIPAPPAEDAIAVDGIRLLRRHPVIVFGDGGDAKSYLALYLASRLAATGLRVLYADWEFAGEDHRLRLERLCGQDMPELWYVRCERPMVAESDRLRRIVQEERIDYVIADSVAFACDGPPEAAEVAAGYFRATRRLGVGSLHTAHTTKADGGDAKPFGSTFWHNGARSTWYVKRSVDPDPGELTIGLFNRKSNTGPLAAPIGYRLTFGEDRTMFERTDLSTVIDLATRLSTRQRMVPLLRGGALTMAEIAGELDTPVNNVVQAVRRGEGKVFVRVLGADGIYRIGLLERGASHG